MRKIISALLIGLLFTTVYVDASAKKGKKIYMRKMKRDCGFNGRIFATKHTKRQWKKLKNKKQFTAEVKKICPKAKRYKKSYNKHLYDFVYKYASDSGKVPAC